MTRYQRVLEILDQSIGGPQATIGVHGPFWRGLSRDQFVVAKVLGRDLLIVGNSAGSNLVKALRGQAPFGADLPTPPLGASFSRMPAGFPPVPDPDIDFIARWIDEGCPDTPLVVPPTATFSWRPTNAPMASSRTDDVFFVDPLVGWAANSDGTIIHTTDGGDHWTVQFQDVPPPESRPVYFRCLGFADAQRGWAGTLTSDKRLFATDNGGQHWRLVTNLPPGAPSAICGLSVVNRQVAYASGTNFPNRPARMMKTVDGGQSWTAWEMAPWADLLVDCYFTDPLHGWVVGGKLFQQPAIRGNIKPVILETHDGGQTWVNRAAALAGEFPPGEWGWKIQFVSSQLGFVSLENFTRGAILKTLDGGLNWQRLVVNDPQGNANLEGIGFRDENHGWVGGWGDALFQRRSSSETLDGGLTWRDANEIGLGINRFRFLGPPPQVGYASGTTVYKYAAHPTPTLAAVAGGLGKGGKTPTLCDSCQPVEASGPVRIPVTVPPGSRRFSVYIWDRFGEWVRTLLDEPNPTPGVRNVTWDRTDQAGQSVPPGQYLWRLTTDRQRESRIINLREARGGLAAAPAAIGGHPAASVLAPAGVAAASVFYRPPADIDDFSRSPRAAELRQAWHDYIAQAIERRAADGQRFYDAAHDPTPGTSPTVAQVPWNGFPRSIWQWFNADGDPTGRLRAFAAAETLRAYTYVQILGEPSPRLVPLTAGLPPLRRMVNGALAEPVTLHRRQQDEYCEWHVDRQGDKIVRISFTAEGPEYWERLAALDPALVTQLYQEFIDPAVTQADLFWNTDVYCSVFNPAGEGQFIGHQRIFLQGEYNPSNVWNTFRGAMHLTHPANTLGAEINLAADATVLYPSVSPTPASTLPARLICCAGYGGVNRSSDPAIGAFVNALVRDGNCVTLANPVGLYLSKLDLSGLAGPQGQPLPGALTIRRASPGGAQILRAELKPPTGANFTLDQCTVDLEPLRYGGQFARQITMTLFGLAKPIPGREPQISACQAKCCGHPTRPNFSLPIAASGSCADLTPGDWQAAAPTEPSVPTAPGVAALAAAVPAPSPAANPAGFLTIRGPRRSASSRAQF